MRVAGRGVRVTGYVLRVAGLRVCDDRFAILDARYVHSENTDSLPFIESSRGGQVLSIFYYENQQAQGSSRRAGRVTMARQARRMAQGKGQRILSFYIVTKSHSHRLLELWERLLVAKDAFQATALSLKPCAISRIMKS